MLRPPSLRDVVVLALLVAGAATFLYAGSADLPLVLWDESRTAVNALEMLPHGLALVTTYGGAADLWNTKPPLLIWLMMLSIEAFGASETALRVPTMIASLATVAMVFGFTRRATRSWPTATLAGALLVLSPGFLGEHAARTADYDALLTAFTTGFAMLGFVAVHRRCAGAAVLGCVGALAAAAAMTKGVAAVLPAIGLVAHAVVVGRWRRLLAWRWIATALAAATPLALFLVARDAAAPGYLAAVWHNDIAGRAATSLIGTRQPATFYLAALAAGFFAGTPLLLMVPIAATLARGRERLALVFAGVMTAVVLGVVSIAASKLAHYLLPALPFMAIAVAIAVRVLIARARETQRPVVLAAAIGVAAIGMLPGAANVLRGRFAAATPRIGTGENASAYGPLLARLAPGAARVTAIDPGFPLEGHAGYAPVLRAYRLMWRTRGVDIAQRATPRILPAGLVVSCDPATAAMLAAQGRDIAATPGCAAIRR